MSRDLFRFERVSVEGEHGLRLDDVSVALPDDAVSVVLGRSGAGKSTLLRLCNRLEVPSSGRVLLRDEDVAAVEPRALRRRVGMVFQQAVMLGGSIRDNLAAADAGVGGGTCREVLKRVGLPDRFLDRPASDLSGGEAQRVAIARTLLTRPEVLVMDEPTAHLDPESAGPLEELVTRVAGHGTPVVWVTHDPEQMRRIADHVVVLDQGRVTFTGSPTDATGVLAAAGFSAAP